MSRADEYWRYAAEALCSARQSKSEKEKQDQLDLVRTWTEAALRSEFGIDGRGWHY